MFGRDPLVPLHSLISPKVRYLGTEVSILSLESLKIIVPACTTNLELVQKGKKKILKLRQLIES